METKYVYVKPHQAVIDGVLFTKHVNIEDKVWQSLRTQPNVICYYAQAFLGRKTSLDYASTRKLSGAQNKIAALAKENAKLKHKASVIDKYNQKIGDWKNAVRWRENYEKNQKRLAAKSDKILKLEAALRKCLNENAKLKTKLTSCINNYIV